MLDAAVQAAGLATMLDAVLSVDAVRLYKPRPEVYAMITSRFGVKPAEVVFVSSNRWDVMGAARFGFRPLWVNRSNMPDEYPELPPMQIVTDLSALASWIPA
jgi:2-haloacid dehalogenase